MSLLQAVILGVVEGFTEYLPVSSTGHLILTQRILGIPETAAANAFAICIQAGAILAVLGLYRNRVREMISGILGKAGFGTPNETGFQLSTNVVVAFLPAAFIGLLLDDVIERKLFGLWPIVTAWFVGGAAILCVVWCHQQKNWADGRSLEGLTLSMALAVGLLQCLAMWPGTSRSLVTIVGGVVVGLNLTAAVEFSFLLGVVTLLAATVYKAKDAGPLMIAEYGWLPMIIGSMAAWLSAVFAVKWMVGFLKRRGMGLFGYYRVALAVVVGMCLATDVLRP